jgi:hypothetical protein
MKHTHPLILVAARYDDAIDVVDDLEKVRQAYLDLHLDADVAVVALGRHADGSLHVLRRYEEHRSRGKVAHGLEIGLVAGAALALLPTVGLGAVAAGVLGGTATGAAAQHVTKTLTERDLQAIEDTLTAGEFALLIVGPTALEDQLRGIIPKAATHQHHRLHERALRYAKGTDG